MFGSILCGSRCELQVHFYLSALQKFIVDSETKQFMSKHCHTCLALSVILAYVVCGNASISH